MSTVTIDPVKMSLVELGRELARGTLSSREIVVSYLNRIGALDERLHAFVDVYRDSALAAAREADRERQAGNSRGPLHGVPIALKDLLHIRGRITTAGSKHRPHGVASETATVVERLLAAGMIPLGKTHLVEFAFGGWGCNEPMGAPWNPWDTATHRVAGGSSSGSAVAVAGALAPAALGTDTGGSVRIPASLCGITGFKPTYGVSSLAGVFPLATTLDSVGPLTRDVDDAALLLAAMSGPDPRDPATLGAPAIDFAGAMAAGFDLTGIRIAALPVGQFSWPADPAVLAAREAAMATLLKLGAAIDEAPAPFDLHDVMVRNGRIIAAEAYALHRVYIGDETVAIDPWVRKRTLAGKDIGAIEYRDALAARERAASSFAEWMHGRDALLTPTLPITATPLDQVDEATTPLATFTRAVNYVGGCGVSLPAGFSHEGLPIGIQLIGAPFADATLVRIGRAFQSATDWHRRRPDLSAWESSPKPSR
jgi:aspartyl-tRNA(Asn)/glutamyl-tRNA(Gln) amidotransferase subunit A